MSSTMDANARTPAVAAPQAAAAQQRVPRERRSPFGEMGLYLRLTEIAFVPTVGPREARHDEDRA